MLFNIPVVFIVLSQLSCGVYGNVYSVGLLGVEVWDEENMPTSWYEFIVINTNDFHMWVTVTNNTHLVRSIGLEIQEETSFTLDALYGLNGLEYTNKTLFFESDYQFTLQVFSHSASHAEGFVAIPLDSLLGPHVVRSVFEYVVTTFCATSGFCQLAITTFQPAIVKIAFPPTVTDIVFCIGETYFRSGRDSVLNMTKFESVQIETSRDLTGTHIYSNTPIAVFVGSRGLATNSSVVHTLEQLPTSSQWGKEYGVKAIGDSEYGDIIKITSGYYAITSIEMYGFGSFTLAPYEVVTRRLDTEAYTIVKASKPIQVTQISGYGQYSEGVTPHMALTVVPAMEHRIDYTRLSCGIARDMGKFVTFTEKLNKIPLLDAIEMSVANDIMYSDYKIYSKTGRGLELYTLDGKSLSGVVQCLNGPAFPLSVKHSQSNMVPQGDDTETLQDMIDGTCIESEVLEYHCNKQGEALQLIGERSFVGFTVLKLRVKACGTTLMQLRMDEDLTIMIHMHLTSNAVTLCDNGACNETTVLDGAFNNHGKCKDFSWYWVQEYEEAGGLFLSFGTGPSPNNVKGQDQSYTTPLVKPVKSFSLMGLYTNATFFYDLEQTTGCTTWVSEWRCVDKFDDCSLYGKGMCSNAAYSSYATEGCRKYCGLCKTDNYGRKFVGVIHSFDGLATPMVRGKVYVTSATPIRTIVAATSEQALSVHITDDTDMYFAFHYPTGFDPTRPVLLWVISDTDVAVSVVLCQEDLGRTLSYNVFPTDIFDTEYQTMTYSPDGGEAACVLVTEGADVEVNAYFTGTPNAVVYDDTTDDYRTLDMHDSAVVRVGEGRGTSIRITDTNDLDPGILLKSDKPFAVYCGGNGDHTHFNAMFPTKLLGTSYSIPGFVENDDDFLTKIKIIVQPLKPETVYNLTGGHDYTGTFPTPTTRIRFKVTTLDDSFQLTSNEPITVGILIESKQQSWFFIPPPVEHFLRQARDAGPIAKANTTTYFVSREGKSAMVRMDGDEEIYISTTDNVDTEIGDVFGIIMRTAPEWNNLVTMAPTFSGLEPQEPPETCKITKPRAGDGIDNDCDGYVDENICCLEDSDLDGSFTDDFSKIIADPITWREEPSCIPINKPLHQCWTVCQCPCHWVENLIASRRLSREEFMRIQMIKALAIQEKLKLNKDELTKTTIQKISAEDQRPSAASMGYVGVTLLVLSVSFIVFLDISAIKRDLAIFFYNIKDGVQGCNRRVRCKK